MPFIAIALAVAAVIGGGTAAAAQSSLPGDALWGFKVYVNEGVQGALSTSHEAKAEWDLSSIEARLDEAAALAAEGRLDAKAQARINANVQAHAKGLAGVLAVLEEQGNTLAAADVAARYQGVLAARVGTLADAEVSAEGTANAGLSPLIKQVRNTLDSASELSASVNAAVDTNTTVEVGL